MTSVLDIIFGGGGDRVHKKEFNQALGQIPEISREEKNYLNEVFKKDLEDGITKEEMKNKIRELNVNYEDDLDAREVKQIKQKFLGRFDD
jgi:hypothetical protein